MAVASKIGVIGAGKMAGALIKGWLGSGVLKAEQVLASVPKQDAQLLEPLAALGCRTTHNNREVGEWADTVLLGVKPHIVQLVAGDLTASGGKAGSSSQLAVSIAAGLDTEKLGQWLGDKFRVVRVMPNTAVEVMEGASVYSTGQTATRDDCTLVESLFGSVGACWRVGEGQLDAVTGISGSGPAYMYLVLEALTEEGVRQGLDPVLSQQLAAQTMLGAGKMATKWHPAILRGEVTSPGGSTAEGVRALEKGGLRFTLMEAVAATADKCRRINRGGNV